MNASSTGSQQGNALATMQAQAAMNRYNAGEQRDLDALLSFGVSSGGTASVGSSASGAGDLGAAWDANTMPAAGWSS
jgi:hypothetical protein